MDENKILVLGVGNILLSDEGVGIKVTEHLKEISLPENVAVLDGGTGGFHLLELFQTYEVIIIIDATIDDKKPGTVKVLEPRFSSDFPRSLSSHDIGLKDLLDSASILGNQPKIFLIAITVSNIRDFGMILTPEVEAAIPGVIDQIREIIGNYS